MCIYISEQVWLYVGKKKKRGSEKSRAQKRVCEHSKTDALLRPRKTPLFSTKVRFVPVCAFVFGPQNWSVFFTFFAYKTSVEKPKFLLFKTQNPPKARLG